MHNDHDHDHDHDRTSRQPRPSRQRRRLLRYRGNLRCEWCSRMCEVAPGTRWSALPLAEWEQVVKSTAIYFCHRARCVASRAEFGYGPSNVDLLSND